MQEPALRDAAFLDNVARARQQTEQLHLWWMGQSGFLLLWQGSAVLLDPYLSDSLTRKYADSDRPHERMTSRVVAPQALSFVDVLTSSHNHTDHLDAETILPLLETNPQLKLVAPVANVDEASRRLELPPERLTPIVLGQPLQLDPFIFHAIPAAHETLQSDAQGQPRYIGLIIEAGPWTVYHSGDTVRYEGMVEILKPWQPDVALLPINGRDAARGVAGNLSGPEAVQLARDIGARLVVPCHYDMFAFNTASTDSFIAAARAQQQPYHILRNGERLSLPVVALEARPPQSSGL